MTATTNTVLASAIAKLEATNAYSYKEFKAKCKIHNLLMPMPLSGFKMFCQLTAALTPEESEAVYFDAGLAHGSCKCDTLEELLTQFPDETSKFKLESEELFAKGCYATVDEIVGVLQDELCMKHDVAVAYAKYLGFPETLSAEQQASTDAYNERENMQDELTGNV